MTDKLSTAAVVILYHPPASVLDNIKSYSGFVDKVYVFDNSEVEQAIKKELVLLPNVEYYHDFENAGIAKRLNAATSLAAKENYEWLLTMDQDSSFAENEIAKYLECVRLYKEKDKVAMFGTEYENDKRELFSECSPVEADNLITSGMLLNLSLVQKIGSFDENLFIDSVDHDYVIRAKLNGYSVIRFANVHIVHSLGEEVNRASIKTLFLVKKKKVVHSPLRCYYMYRNMLYLENKFRQKDVYLLQKLRKIVTGNLLANIFYGRNAWETFRYLIRASKDYKQDRMGRIEN